MKSFNLGMLQMDSGNDFRENLRQGKRLVQEAADRGADMVMFPETMEYIGEDMSSHGQKVPGEILDYFRELAVNHKIYVHGGTVTEYREGGNPRNTSLLVSPEGVLLGSYSKLHMFDIRVEEGPSYCESSHIAPGGEIVLVRTKLGTFGLAVCYDLRFPEMFRLMSQAGAQMILVAANFTKDTGKDHWETLVRARAIENTCFLAACNQTGSKPAFEAYGNSMAVDPWGRVLTRASRKPGCIMVPVDLSQVEKVRTQLPSLENIREDVYSLASSAIKVYEE